jgi:methionyl-tRNA synthetase
VLVTSALPYANGSIHLGHLVEYVQTDVYVRYRRSLGDHVTYVCAADSHGTPIEVNAARAGVSPKAFVERYREEQHRDFQRFGVDFSTYYTTDSEENRRWAWRVWDALKARGLVYKRSVEQLYCEKDARFLPDRFVKGTCPRCDTPDQYGDVCESCGTTYDPRDLKAPRCALCGSAPVVRASDHAYVDLKKVEPVVRAWVDGEGHLEAGVREQVRGWLADLQDWCITRDAPYFGFPVRDPEFPGKFIYVWLDAPIGYLSSGEHYFAEEAPPGERLDPAAYEARYLAPGAPSRLEHFIGKDILRFHAVFWPAMLWATGLRLPDRLAVHGHLTVNGEKMSKSRGTFVTARAYLDAGLDPQLLRYYYAANLGPGVTDLDLSLEEFRNRINADLANNVANLASRVFALVERAGAPLEGAPEERIAGAAREALRVGRAAYQALEYREVIRCAREVADLCNKRMQEAKPWEAPASEGSRRLLLSCAKALRAVAVLLWPVMPTFADGLATAFGQARPPTWTPDLDPFAGPPVHARERPPQVARLDAKQVARLLAPPEGPARVSAAPSPAETATRATARPAGGGAPAPAGGPAPAPGPGPAGGAAAAPGTIGYDDFARVDLRVAIVREAERVPKADKLLRLSVDVGEGAPRTIVAGIAASHPDPAALVGRRIVVVANLEPRALRGITSQGMLLAAGDPPRLVTVGDEVAPGTRVK